MAVIDIRALKIHASDIIRKVKENRSWYIVTDRGRLVAAIIPIEEALSQSVRDTTAWDELESIGEQIGHQWQFAKSSTDLLSNMRR
jgi:prevent-host-death family protein